MKTDGEPPLVLVAGGGTGGHVFPALAAAGELVRRGARVEFAGTAHGFEARLVPAAGFVLHTLPVRGLSGKPPLARLAGAALLAVAMGRAIGLVRRLRPAVALGVGGYASFPALAAARLAGVPIVLHEQNAVPGLANRALARFAAAVAVSWPDAGRGFGRDVVVTGNPVREAFFGLPGVAPGPPVRLLVFGGSQGSHALNQAMLAALPRLDPERIRIVHQTGVRELAEVQAAYAASRHRGSRVVAFLDDMPREIGAAALVLSRAGATTSAELAAAGRPALLVPFARAAGGHQERNARALERAGAAEVLLESELDGATLAARLTALAGDPVRLVRMGAAARTLARPRAAADLAELVLAAARS